jgi:phosphomannomutase
MTFRKILRLDALIKFLYSIARECLVIGRDGRLSGVELMSALKEGLKSTGCHVVDIGMVPTHQLPDQ